MQRLGEGLRTILSIGVAAATLVALPWFVLPDRADDVPRDLGPAGPRRHRARALALVPNAHYQILPSDPHRTTLLTTPDRQPEALDNRQSASPHHYLEACEMVVSG